MNWGADIIKFGAQNVFFSMLVASNLAPWGPSSDAGELGVPGLISIDFGRISEPPFGSFWLTLEQQLSFFACVFVGQVF